MPEREGIKKISRAVTVEMGSVRVIFDEWKAGGKKSGQG